MKPAFQIAQAVTDQGRHLAADRFREIRVAGGTLLDDAFEHRSGKGDAAGLDRLQVDGSEKMDGRVVGLGGEEIIEPGNGFALCARTKPTGSSFSNRSRMVGPSFEVMS